ncbi:MAG: VOC family protein [Steroidobacteraceae bacterium]
MTTLDHLGFTGPRLEVLRDEFRALGFSPTSPEPLLARAVDSGEVRSLGQTSCHIVLQHSYIELSSVASEDPAHHLAPWQPRRSGIKILALAPPDLQAEHARLQRMGLHPTPLAFAARDIGYGDHHGQARFSWFMLPAKESPAGLVCWVRNECPELVYQSAVMHHANSAMDVDALLLASDDPAATAQHYARLLAIEPQPAGKALRLALARGAIEIYGAGDLPAGSAGPRPADGCDERLAGLALRFGSRTHMLSALAASGLGTIECAAGLGVDCRARLGAWIILRSG